MTVDALSELDLSYTPPLGSPWDAVQMASPGLGPRHQPRPPARPRVTTVLFVCEHNAGRSQLAAGLAAAYAGDRVNVLSAGTAPDAAVSRRHGRVPGRVGHRPLRPGAPQLTDELLPRRRCRGPQGRAGVPAPTGIDQQTWDLPNPADWDVDSIRPLRDHIDGLVQDLLRRQSQPHRTAAAG